MTFRRVTMSKIHLQITSVAIFDQSKGSNVSLDFVVYQCRGGIELKRISQRKSARALKMGFKKGEDE